MGFMEKIVQQCRRPTGLFGRFVGMGMNAGHARLQRWGLSHVSISTHAVILDVGCGGGKAVYEMARVASSGKVCGIDYSAEMAKLSRKVNKRFVDSGSVEILHASVASLPFADGTFNVATAFETSYFWPDFTDNLKEIKRVLQSGGTLLIANEVYEHEKFTKRNLKWAKWANMMIHTPEEYRSILTEAGYVAVEVDELPEKNWITIKGRT
jgi:ubiquinone/menaquinone biosynthesis C-methylase UbiE